MKIINTRTHAFIDYLIVFFLLLSPKLFDLTDSQGMHDAAAWMVPCVAAMVKINVSVLTCYEGSIFEKIPMRVHLSIDRALGLFLAFSPWLFGFDLFVYKPHVAIGLVLFLIASITDVKKHAGSKRKRKRNVSGSARALKTVVVRPSELNV